MKGWFPRRHLSRAELLLQRCAHTAWGDFPPRWVFETDHGDERPLVNRYADLDAFRAYEPNQTLGAFARVLSDVGVAATQWAASQTEPVYVRVTLDLEPWRSGEIPVPWMALLLVRLPDDAPPATSPDPLPAPLDRFQQANPAGWRLHADMRAPDGWMLRWTPGGAAPAASAPT